MVVGNGAWWKENIQSSGKEMISCTWGGGWSYLFYTHFFFFLDLLILFV